MNRIYTPHIPNTEEWGIYKDMRPYIHGSFVAMPGDVIALPHVYTGVLDVFQSEDVKAAITLSPDISSVDTHGVGFILNKRVTNLYWPPPQVIPTGYLRDMTIWTSDMQIFDLIETYPFPKKSIGYVFMKAVADKLPIGGHYYSSPWIHIGYPDDLAKSFKL